MRRARVVDARASATPPRPQRPRGAHRCVVARRERARRPSRPTRERHRTTCGAARGRTRRCDAPASTPRARARTRIRASVRANPSPAHRWLVSRRCPRSQPPRQTRARLPRRRARESAHRMRGRASRSHPIDARASASDARFQARSERIVGVNLDSRRGASESSSSDAPADPPATRARARRSA